jgi:hypothetical protein
MKICRQLDGNLASVLVQCHFDHVCTSWFTSSPKHLKNKLPAKQSCKNCMLTPMILIWRLCIFSSLSVICLYHCNCLCIYVKNRDQNGNKSPTILCNTGHFYKSLFICIFLNDQINQSIQTVQKLKCYAWSTSSVLVENVFSLRLKFFFINHSSTYDNHKDRYCINRLDEDQDFMAQTPFGKRYVV